MTTQQNPRLITLSLTIPASMAGHLAAQFHYNFAAEQPDRFWRPAADLLSPLDEVFADGVMMFTESMSDALLLRACHEELGFVTTLVSDECGIDYPWVVVSSCSVAAAVEGTYLLSDV